MSKFVKILTLCALSIGFALSIALCVKSHADDYRPQDYVNIPMHYKFDPNNIVNNWMWGDYKHVIGADNSMEGIFDRTLYLSVQSTNNVFTNSYNWYNMGDQTLLTYTQIKNQYGNRVLSIDRYEQIGLNADGNVTYLCPITIDNRKVYVEVNTSGTAIDNYNNPINITQLLTSTITFHGDYVLAYDLYYTLNDFGTWHYPYGVWEEGVSQTGTLEDLIYAVVNTPLMYVRKIFDFTLLGTNVLQLIATILLIALVVKVWRSLK